ncbi:MAG TPA: YraN family protein [Bacillaceae bacterium]|nr:YraN family protein [Bacillaceae bacterium]
MRAFETGRFGEALARHYLEERGYRIVGQNIRFRFGEIDLVATRDDYLVFVEVKTRRREGNFGTGREAVTLRKSSRLVRLAQAYVLRYGCDGRRIRFDVIEVVLDVRRRKARVLHLPNAFEM